MIHPALAVIVVPVSLVLAAGGCGASSSGSNSASKFHGVEKAVATAVEDFQKAAEKSDEGKICRDLITVQLRDQIAKANAATAKDCPQAVSDGLKETDSSDLTVTAVTLSGATNATATVKQKTADKKSKLTTISLVKSNNRWRISKLGA